MRPSSVCFNFRGRLGAKTSQRLEVERAASRVLPSVADAVVAVVVAIALLGSQERSPLVDVGGDRVVCCSHWTVYLQIQDKLKILVASSS